MLITRGSKGMKMPELIAIDAILDADRGADFDDSNTPKN